MLMSQVKEIRHHADEIQAILNKNTKVESWVLAKAERSSTDLSDITHYLDGRVQEMEKGGRYNTGRAWTLDHNQHNKSEDYEVSSQNRKFAKGGISEQDVNELKNILDKDYVTFVKLLGENIKDPKFKSTVVELAKLNKTKFRNIDVPCDKLIPTQNEISLDKSLAFPLTSAYDAERYLKAEEPLKIKGNRILTCDNGKFVIDGHHRWSQVFVLNPKAKMACTDFYELKDPFTGLKATQIGISADLGYLPTQNVQDINLLTVSEKTLKDYVTTKMTNEVREVFKDNGIDNPEEHIWRNVLLLKSKNKPIKNAPSRDYMPQTDLAENFAEYVPNVKNFAHGGMIEVGDLVRVKKYGWVMRVAGFEDGFYYLENDREGTMNGNAGSYLPHDIESFEKYENGGMVKWQDVEVGDSANVKSENKTGIVIKTYGRKFHLKFVDGSEKTYDASELTFIKDDEDFDNGGEVDDDDMGVKFIDYKGKTIMFEPHFKMYYSNDVEFDSLEKAKKYIDSGSKSPDWERLAYKKGLMAKGGETKNVDGYVVYFGAFRYGRLTPVITEYHKNLSDAEKSVEEKKAKKEKGWKIKELSKMPTYSEVRIFSHEKNYDKVKDYLHSYDKVEKFFEGKDSFYKKDHAWVKPKGYDWDNWQLKKMGKGGVTFNDKVESISTSLLKRKKVSPSVQKDYGKTYSKKEALESAKRIAGAMRKKETLKKK